MRSLFQLLILLFVSGYGYPQPHFSDNFIEKNKNKFTATVPEVQELVHIIFAITEKGLNDSDMINHQGDYYKEVLKHFQFFANEPLVLAFNKELKGGLFYGSRYSRLKMDACGFYFKDDQILKDTVYTQLNWDNRNYIAPYINQLEEFALKTGFRKFYMQHQAYYDTLIQLMYIQVPVQKMWQWLEERFPARYDNYWISFSPLANGHHSTNYFEVNDFKQCVMFLCGPFEDSFFSKVMQEGLMSKVAFTEIDHNYVNPITDNFKTQVNKIFADRNKWTDGKSSNGYKTPISVFNEYMTYAIFILYLNDNFSDADFENLYRRISNQMVNGRGFSFFKEFTDTLSGLYKQQKSPTSIPLLYPALLQWCGSSNFK